MTVPGWMIALAAAGAFALLSACDFHEYAQVEDLGANIDEHRTGCQVDSTALLAGYLQYEANAYHFGPDPTPTPGPATRTDLSIQRMLEEVWEHGCMTGRRDAMGAEAATLAGLRDAITVLEAQLADLDE